MTIILKILGIVFIGIVLVIAGVNILDQSDTDLINMHPPDPDHHHWPEDGDIL